MPLYDSATLYDSAVVTYDGRNSWDTSPSISIYLAFDGTPYQVAPVWTDVTGYVSQVDTDRSRSDDFSAFVSTATVTFRNETQLFSPFNTSGTYYGKLKPRLQIKIEATVLGNIYPVFRGFCAGFPVSNTEAGYASTVTVQCFDALALLATELVSDYVADFTLSLNPSNYWQCNDGPSSSDISDAVGANPLLPAGANRYRQGSELSSSLLTRAILVQDYKYETAINSTTASASAISISGWFQLLDSSADSGYWGITWSNGSTYFKVVLNAASTRLRAEAYDSATGFTSYTGSNAMGYSSNMPPIFITIVYRNVGAAIDFYINGVPQAGGGASLVTFNSLPFRSAVAYKVQMQEFSICYSLLSSSQALALYNYNINNLSETSAVRFNRLMAMTPFSTSLTSVTTTPVATVGAMPKPKTNLVQALTRTADSEGGFMYVDRAGKICFRERTYVYTNTSCNTSQATFSTAGIRFEPEVQMELTGDNIRNDITVTFSGGGTTNKTNATSIAAYGTNAMSLDTDLSTIAQAKTLGEYTATVAGNLTSDLSPVRVNTTNNEANWATLLGLEVLDRTTITIAPQTGSSFTKIQLLNSIQHHITPSAWEMTIDGSSQYTAFFILDKSSLNGTDLLQ